MTTRRTNPEAGYRDSATAPRGPEGRPLCRRCETEVPKGRRSFCSDPCIHEWRLRSDPGYLRNCVKKRDKGVCRTCGVDTYQQRRIASAMPYLERQPYLDSIKAQGRTTFWDADHILSVVDGGGETGLDNLQTLCCLCHKTKTAELARTRAEARRTEKLKEK